MAMMNITAAKNTKKTSTASTASTATTVAIQKALEEAYFEGQHDALTGDVRIKFNDTTKYWRWTKSPWDSGLKPIYNPGDN